MVQELISIIVPVYNVEQYLRMCSDSIMSQLLKILVLKILKRKMVDYQMHVIME